MQDLEKIWDGEYSNKRFMTGSMPPQSLVNFVKFVKKTKGLRGKDYPFENYTVLDLGSGEGKNAAFFASLGARVTAIDISGVALLRANEKYKNLSNITFIKGDFSNQINLKDNAFDIIIDVTSSNSLSDKQRDRYMKLVKRVLKADGFFFVRALLLDGDKNAKTLLKKFPGKEQGSYILPKMKLQEKVFQKDEFLNLYGKYFKIIKIIPETHYTKFDGQTYKRNFLLSYMQNI